MAARKKAPAKKKGRVVKAKARPPKTVTPKSKPKSKVPPRTHKNELGGTNIAVYVYENGVLIHQISASNLDDRRYIASNNGEIINKPPGQSFIGFARALLQRLV